MPGSKKLEGTDPFAGRRGPSLENISRAMLPEKATAIVKSNDGKSQLFKQFKLTPVGLEVHGQFTIEDWKEAGVFFRGANSAVKLWIGDWINAVPRAWGDKYTEAAEITGFKEKTLRNIASVCRNVNLSRRRDKLAFNHFALVASLADDKQEYWLDRAATEGISANKLNQMINPPTLPAEPLPPIFDKKHRRKFNKLWKGVMSKDPVNINRADIQHIRVWLEEVEQGLDEAEKVAKQGADNANP